MTNDKKLNAKDLAKVQGGKGRAPARASGGRTSAGSASSNKGSGFRGKTR